MRALPGNGKWWMDAHEDTAIMRRGMDKGERREKKGKRQKKQGRGKRLNTGDLELVLFIFLKKKNTLSQKISVQFRSSWKTNSPGTVA